jgi:diketogulonate reductase-like aldo/keto reductase
VKGQGGKIPQVGLGTSTLKGDECVNAVKSAIKAGYRMIDTALLYNNHKEVGDGIRQALKDNGLTRDDIFLTSKVAFFPPDASNNSWMFNANNVKGNEEASIDTSLEELGFTYTDMFLVHNPTTTQHEYNFASVPHFFELFALKGNEGAVAPAVLPNGHLVRPLVIGGAHQEHALVTEPTTSLNVRVATWKAMEKAKRNGKCRYIGVSNYTKELLVEMKEYAEIMPAVNQLEYHPRFASPELVKAAKELGVVLIGYGTGLSIQIEKSPVLQALASKNGRSPHQVLLRWMKQLGIVSIPRSSSLEHQKENISIFDFELSDDDMMTLSRMNQRHPYYWDPVVSNQTYRNQVVKFALNSAVKVKSGLSSLQEGVMDRFNQMQIPDAINRIRGSFSSSPAEDVSKEEKSEPGNAGEPTVEIDLDDK